MTESPPSPSEPAPDSPPRGEADDDRVWRVDGVSAEVQAAARAAARRAGVPLAAWLAGLIRHAAAVEAADGAEATPADGARPAPVGPGTPA